jgi:hypothetical protein
MIPLLLQTFIGFLILKTGFWRSKYLQFFSSQGINDFQYSRREPSCG